MLHPFMQYLTAEEKKNASAFLIKNCTSSGGCLVMCDVGWTSRISFAQILTRTTPPRPHAFTPFSVVGRTDGLSSSVGAAPAAWETLDLILRATHPLTRISLDMHASTRTHSAADARGCRAKTLCYSKIGKTPFALKSESTRFCNYFPRCIGKQFGPDISH